MTGLVLSGLLISVFSNHSLYDPTALLNFNLQARKIIAVWTLSFLGLAGLLFAFKIGGNFSRGAIFLFYTVGLVLLLAHRAFWRMAIESAMQKGALRGRKSVFVCMH